MTPMEFETVEVEFRDRRLPLVQMRGVSSLVRQSLTGSASEDPYWACVWPSSRALVRAVGEWDDWDGLDVLELGCGPGAGAVAAAVAGARSVLASDRVERAGEIVAENGRRCGVQIEFRSFDWNEPPPELGTFHRILASDVLYADGMLSGLLRFFSTRLQRGGKAVVTDPARVMPAGITGAARLRGLDMEHRQIAPGTSVLGGANLFVFSRR